MNKARFQMPPRASSANHWVTTAAGASWSDIATADAAEISGSAKLPFLLDLFAAHRRNMEAWTAANRVVWQGAQAVVRCNVEMMQQTVEGVSGTLQAMSDPENAAERAMRQTETAIRACENAAANVQELREIIHQTGSDALQVLNRRFAEAAEEARSFTRCTVRTFSDTDPGTFWQVS